MAVLGADITDAAGEEVAAQHLRLDGAEVVHGDPVDGAVSEPATVERVAVTSAPQDDRTYRLGEAITVEVRFSTEATVSGSPQLALTHRRRRHGRRRDAAGEPRFRGGGHANVPLPGAGGRRRQRRDRRPLGRAAPERRHDRRLEQAQLVIPAHRVDGQTADA